MPGRRPDALGTTILPDRREDGTIAGCQIVAVDATKYGEAIEAAQRSERRLRLIMDQIPVTITYIDSSYTYRYINRAQELWLGKSFQEVVNRGVRTSSAKKCGGHRTQYQDCALGQRCSDRATPVDRAETSCGTLGDTFPT